MSHGEQSFPWETPPELWRGFKTANPNWQGKTVALYIAPKAAGPMVSIAEVRASTLGSMGRVPCPARKRSSGKRDTFRGEPPFGSEPQGRRQGRTFDLSYGSINSPSRGRSRDSRVI